MTADGPSANRPPHSLLDVSMRLIIAALLTLALAGCDKGKQDQPQEQASIARIDRSLAGQEAPATPFLRSEEHTSELQSLMRISYAVFCLKKKNKIQKTTTIDIRAQKN